MLSSATKHAPFFLGALTRVQDRLVLATEHSSSAVQTKVRVEVEPTRLVETVLCYKETTVLGLIQTMNRKYGPVILFVLA